jgi:tetratricopeptide (TPR) repeat protein
MFKWTLRILTFCFSFLLLGGSNYVYGVHHRADLLSSSAHVGNSNDSFLKEYEAARDLTAKGEWVKASEKFNKIIKEYPRHNLSDAVLYWLAFTYKKQNKFSETEETLARLIREFPSSPWLDDARVMLAEISAKFVCRDVAGQVICRQFATPPTPNKSGQSETTTLEPLAPFDFIDFSVNDGTLDANSEIKLAALRSLFSSNAQKGLEAAREMLRIDSKASERLKEQVIYLTTRSGGKSAAALFIEVARRETNPKVLKAAISALGRINSEAGTEFLLQRYDSENDKDIKEKVLLSLAGHPRAVSKLTDIARGDADIRFRRIAFFGLSRIGGTQAIDTFLQLYDRESNPVIKIEILLALGLSRDKRAIRKLIDVARNEQSSKIKITAINALSGIDDPEAIKFLQEVIK